MPGPSRSFLGLWALCACSLSLPDAQVTVSSVPAEGAKVALFLTGDGRVAVRRLDRAFSLPLPVKNGNAEVYALLYDRTLEELQLSEGELAFVPEGAPGRALPEGARVVRRRIEGGRVSEWIPQDALDEALIARRLPLPCASLSQGARIVVPTTNIRVVAMLALDEDRVLVTNNLQEVYIARSDGVLEPLNNPEETSIFSAIWGPERARLIAASRGGRVFYWDLQTGETTTIADLEFHPKWMAANEDHSALLLHGTTGEVSRVDVQTGQVELLDTLTEERPGLGLGVAGTILNLGGDRFLVGREATVVTLHAEGSAVQRRLLPEGNGPTSSILHAGDVVAATVDGLARLQGQRWERFEPSAESIRPRALVADPDGFWVAGQSGALQQYLGAFTQFCPPVEDDGTGLYRALRAGPWLVTASRYVELIGGAEIIFRRVQAP